MNHSRKRVLEMLAKGDITSDEAERLLDQLGAHSSPMRPDEGPEVGLERNDEPKYLCINTKPKGAAREAEEPAEIRIPLVLVKAGMKLEWLITEIFADHGMEIDLNSIDKSSLAEIIGELSKNPLNIDTEHQNVQIYLS